MGMRQKSIPTFPLIHFDSITMVHNNISLKTLLFATCCALMFAAPASAVVVDDFTEFDGGLTVAGASTIVGGGGYDVTASDLTAAQNISYSEGSLSSVAGTNRSVSTANYTGSGPYTIGLRDGSSSGPHFDFNGSAGNTVDLGLSYAGPSITSDLDGESVFVVSFSDFDLGSATALDVSATLTDGLGSETITHSLGAAEDAANVFDVTFDFGGGAINFADIQSIEFDFVPNGGAVDFTLSQITTAVPEPASLAAWTLLGLIGFGVRRRLRSK
jgi:hypothetical protein